MSKRCSRGKSCGGTCIGNSKACRLEFPSAVRNALNKASEEVGVVELYKAVAAGGKRGGAAQFEKIRRELRDDLGGKNIRAGADAKELKRRLIEAELLPKGKPTEKSFNAQDLFVKKEEEPKKPERINLDAILAPKSVPSALKQELNQLAAKDQQEKLGSPRQLEKSPGARTKTILPPKRAVATDDMLEDISRIMKGEAPQHLSMVGDDSARVKIKSQVAQLQSVLGLGAQTRKDVGRDLEGLLNEARNLEGRLMSQQKGFRGNDQERLALLDRLKKVREAIQGPATKATGNVRYAREDARDHDGDMLSKGITRELGNKSYRWEDSYGSGSTLLGRGAYGTVLREPNKGNAIKRGEVGEIEADLIDRLGKADLGPKLLAAQLDGDSQYHPGVKIGRVAMSVAPGSPIGSKAPDKEIGGVKVADAYWIARANLHRMGIAHNDMHIDNVLIDQNGKARFVDMGLAQDSPKAALAEAMGAFMGPAGTRATRGKDAAGQGDWQFRRWYGTGGLLLNRLENAQYLGLRGEMTTAREKLEAKAPVLARVRDNKAAVMFEMQRDGFTKDDIATIMDHGIRSPLSTYEQGVWSRMTNDQARKYIDLLYEGV